MCSSTAGRFLPTTAMVAAVLLSLATTLHAQTPEPVCVPRVPPSVTMTIDGVETGDWDAFQPQVITYNVAETDTTRLAADATHLYFLTTVRSGNFSEFAVQQFMIAAGPDRMLFIQPFAGSPPPSGFDDKDFSHSNAFQTNSFGGTWTPWPAPTHPTTDFHRFFITSGATPHWRLEGRIALSDLNVSSTDNFDLFLHINSGSGTGSTEKKYWPAHLGGQALDDPAALTFGDNRCPDISFSAPHLAFGKRPFPSSSPLPVTISNTGAPGSQLSIASANLSGDASFGSLSVLKGATAPPFTLSTAETATVEVTYSPAAPSSLAMPHTAQVSLATNDPDPAENPAVLPIEGLARETMDLLFILDQSGSMLDENKWTTTKWATEVAFEVARLFSLPQDRAGAVWFGGPSSTPQSGVLRGLQPHLPNPGSFTDMFSQEAQLLFYTPIGFGLDEAHGTFLGPSGRSNVALLMSDGIHNRPLSTRGATTVDGLDLAAAVFNNTKSMHVNTVALGTDAGVSTTLLDAIKSHYAPGLVAPTYNITAQPEALASVFSETLMETLLTNRIDFDVAVDGFPVPQGAHSVLAMIVWTPGNVPQPIEVRVFDELGNPLTTPITYDSGTSGYHQGSGTNQPFTYVFITDPAEFAENRVWKIVDPLGSPINPALGFPIVLEDLNIIAHFTAEQPAKGTGNDYVLEARLTEVGRPVTNTPEHPVQVEAHLARPGEGLGHLASTVSLGTCQSTDPSLPPVPRDTRVIGADVGVEAMRRAPVSAVVDTSQVDPDTYLFSWADAYFEACGPDALARVQESGLALHDDGTHGDEVAGDGVYTLRFADTEYEGTYVVRFSVVGTTPTGARFARTRTLSTYVPVDVDPGSTDFDQRVFTQADGVTIWEFYVTPRDRFHHYMGPGKRDRVEFSVVGGSGTIVSETLDYNNGIYSTLVRQDPGRPEPVVQATVDGTTISPTRPGIAGRLELGVHASLTQFEDVLGLDDGWGLGAHVGWRLTGSLVLEAEGDATWADSVAVAGGPADPTSGQVYTLFGNLRVDLGGGSLVPFVKAGIGTVLFRGFDTDDDATALQAGAGLSYWLSPSIGLRAQARAVRFEDVFGAGGTTTNGRATAGVVIRF